MLVRLPERFYTDAYEKPKSTHMRIVRPEQWEELLDLLGSYLVYAKQNFGVEPDLFSFNEGSGVYVGLTPETHKEAIRRIGAHFQKIGLKTKMLLGDATGPARYAPLRAGSGLDPEAMQYVGAIGFHWWGSGYAGAVRCLGRSRRVAEPPAAGDGTGGGCGGTGRAVEYDSYQYGLREAKMTQLLLYARPQGRSSGNSQIVTPWCTPEPDGKVEPARALQADETLHGSDAAEERGAERHVGCEERFVPRPSERAPGIRCTC